MQHNLEAARIGNTETENNGDRVRHFAVEAKKEEHFMGRKMSLFS
jgi:hypothetical protein